MTLLLVPATTGRNMVCDPFVSRWQTFLIGRGFVIQATGCYDTLTVAATKKYQRSKGQVADGIVGNMTLNCATTDGFPIFAASQDDNTNKKIDRRSAAYPARPTDLKPPSDASRKATFGAFQFTAAPTKGNPEGIVIDPKWVRDNIVSFNVPGEFSFPTRKVQLHKLVKEPFLELLSVWRKKDLIRQVYTFNGSYVPRFKRGLAEEEALSNHSFGGAFDINAEYNPLGAIPKLVGDVGSVRELVADANKLRWYWGGHYLKQNRLDGMHWDYVG